MNSMVHRIGAVAYLLFFSMVSANTESQVNQPAFVNDFFQQEFQDIQGQISGSNFLQKSVAGEQRGEILDSQALIFPSDHDPLDVVLRRTAALLADLKKSGAGDLGRFESRLNTIKESSNVNCLAKTATISAKRQDLYMQAMSLQRKIALANPLMDFDSLLFVATHTPGIGSPGHIVAEFQGCCYGGTSGEGQSIFMVTGLKTDKPVATNILANSTAQNGRFMGKSLAGGAFSGPELSYDGKTVVFAWRQPGGGGAYPGGSGSFNKESDWHVFKVNVDGSNLVQLTDGDNNDFDPCWLPNNRIAFVTERRGGFGRCHGWWGKTFTIYSMKDDGSDLYCIDYHETNEWQPSVDNNGMIVYSRWDYVDRDAIIAHNMWRMYADGRDSRSWHANYPLPWSTIPGSPLNYGTSDGRYSRPMTEFYIRSIPGSDRYIATVLGHHSYPYGDLILIDLNIPDDNKTSQITRITMPDRTRWYDSDNPSTYQAAWPLSENYYIVNYLSDVVLLDKSGNRQVIVPRSAVPGISSACRLQDPMPLRPRQKPTMAPVQTFQGERKNLPEHKRAVISVVNVYNSDIPLPAGAKIKEFRIVQLIPKATAPVDNPRTNYASQALCRMSLGTAPVESDGSVYCEAPIGKALYFQILDDRGCAIQSMRSASWVHDGEHLTCAGCHDDKWKSTPPGQPLAMKRPPSKLKPEYGTSVEPLGFYRTVKPVFDAKCAPCHSTQGKGPNMSYGSLKNYAFCYDGPQDQVASAPGGGIYHGSRTTPGKHGALQSQLISHLASTHHDVSLTAEEKRRITYWLDCCSMELCAYTRVSDQQAGKLVWPELDCDPTNPQGIEIAFPSPDASTIMGGGDGHPSSDQPLEMRVNGTMISLVNPHQADVRMSLFDCSGRCVYTKVFKQHSSRLTVDARNWPRARGLYILKAFTGKSSATLVTAMVY